MRALIRALRGEHTVLLSSHILSEISQTCDRLLVIQRGEIVAQGTSRSWRRSLGGGGTIEVEVAAPSAPRDRGRPHRHRHRRVHRAAARAAASRCVSLQGAPDLRPKVVRALVQRRARRAAHRPRRGPAGVDLPEADPRRKAGPPGKPAPGGRNERHAADRPPRAGRLPALDDRLRHRRGWCCSSTACCSTPSCWAAARRLGRGAVDFFYISSGTTDDRQRVHLDAADRRGAPDRDAGAAYSSPVHDWEIVARQVPVGARLPGDHHAGDDVHAGARSS